MDESFQARMSRVVAKFKDLKEQPSFQLPVGKLNLPKHGIYLLTEGGVAQYVGRSDNIRSRLQMHTRPSSDYTAASFAALLAKVEVPHKQKYQLKRTDPLHFSNQSAFKNAFAAAKEKIKRMDIRVIEESDAVNQALLEVYVAVVLQTKHNDFSNH